MKRFALLLLLAFALTAPVQAQKIRPSHQWTADNTILAVTSTLGLVLDWGQTLNVRREINPILGPHPSRGAINRYFLTCVVANVGLGMLLPNPYRTVLFVGVTAVETFTVSRNVSLGVRLRF